jgi:hypothetical protein
VPLLCGAGVSGRSADTHSTRLAPCVWFTAPLLVRGSGVYAVQRGVSVGPLHSSKQPDQSNTEGSTCCIKARLERWHWPSR